MAAPALALPSFVSGPLDNLITADVYTASPTKIVNSIQPITAASSVLTSSGILGGASMKSALSAVLSSPVAGLATSAASSLVSSVLKSLPNPNGGSLNLSGLSSGLTSSILGAIGVPSSVSAVLGGVVSKVANSALSDLTGLTGLINTFSCNSGAASINNAGAQATLASSLINAANSMGVKNTFGSVTCGITNQSSLNSIVSSTMGGAVASGDMSSLLSMATSASPGLLTSIQPNVLSAAASNYTPNPGDDGQACYTNITSTFNAVDPTWNTATRATTGGVDNAIDLTTIQSGNDAFQSSIMAGVMTSGDTGTQCMAVGTLYPPMDVSSQLSTQFPSTVYGQSPSTATTSVDPSTVSITSNTTVNNGVTTTDTTTTYGGGSSTTYYPPSTPPPTPPGQITYDPPEVSTDYMLLADGTKATAVITKVNASDGSATLTTVWTYPAGTKYPQGKTVTQVQKVDPDGNVTTDVNTTVP